MAQLKPLRDVEVAFINEHFEGVSFENDYCSAFFDGRREELEAVLQRLLSVNSTSFVTVQSHSKDKQNKRFTEAGTLQALMWRLAYNAWAVLFRLIR